MKSNHHRRPLILHAWGGRHASAGGRQAGKSPHYRHILRPYAQRVLSPRKPPAPPAVPSTRRHPQTAHRNAVPNTRPYPQMPAPQAVPSTRLCPQTTPMPYPARARTSTRTARRVRHAPAPANHLNAVPSTRPHPQPPRCRAQHAPVPRRSPHAVPGTRPHPHTTPVPCPARARTSTRTARRAQHAPAPANHLSVAPHVNTPGGPFPRPWTSSLPGTTPQQLKCSPHSIAPSLPSLRVPPPPGTQAQSLPVLSPLPYSMLAWVRRLLCTLPSLDCISYYVFFSGPSSFWYLVLFSDGLGLLYFL